MEFRLHSHKFAEQIIKQTPEYLELWNELETAIRSISDEDLIAHYQSEHEGKSMSISKSINSLLRDRLTALNWEKESPIFGESEYGSSRWRLDFAKRVQITDNAVLGSDKTVQTGLAVEVAFNHAEAISWNLLKPVLSSELNHVNKAIQTGIGVVICATELLKESGAFDNVVGTFEQFITYSRPLANVLSVPILIVGLEAPENFIVRKVKQGTKTIGFIERY
jgi:hypothetical protein